MAPCGGVCDTEHRTDSPVPLLELTVWQRQQRASNDAKDAIAASWAVERGEMPGSGDLWQRGEVRVGAAAPWSTALGVRVFCQGAGAAQGIVWSCVSM